MGMYTELVLATTVKDEQNVISTLKFMAGINDLPPEELPDHPFFKTERWKRLFRSSSYYFVPKTAFVLEYNEIGKYWCLISRSDLKNYDSEIQLFIDWIRPHLASSPGDMIGYSRYEETREPTIYYVDDVEDRA